MGRKKKKEPEIYHAPFGTTVIPPYPEIDLSPYTIETTSLGDSGRTFIAPTYIEPTITYTGSTGDMRTVCYPARHWEPYTTTLGHEALMKQIEREEEAKVKVNVEHFKGEYICCVTEVLELLPERILMTLSAIKGRLMMEIAPIHIKEFQCSMTPTVRKNIIQASKKIKMYGKKMPIIARFDEYGNRLPDEIDLDTAQGVSLKIVDPAEYGECYLELKAIELPNKDYINSRITEEPWSLSTFFSDDDLPF